MSQNNSFHSLFRALPFSSIPERDRSAFLRDCFPIIKRFERGQSVFNPMEDQKRIYFLDQGEFVNELLTPSGKLIHVRRAKAPMLVGANLFFLSDSSKEEICVTSLLPVAMGIKAVSPSVVITMGLKEFRRSLGRIPSLLDGFLELQSLRFLELSQRLQFLTLGSIRKKTALFLLHLKENRHGQVEIPMSITDLAAHFAVERPSLSAVLKELSEEGVIQRENPARLKILQRNKLEDLLIND